MNGNYHKVISLGLACQPAFQIRRIFGGIQKTYPFDWVVTSTDGLIHEINSNLSEFFSLPNLERNDAGLVINQQSRTQFIHEFPAGLDYLEQHAIHAPRYARRALRWRRLMGSGSRVLFVHDNRRSKRPVTQARRLRDCLETRAPRLHQHLLSIVTPGTDCPDERGISFWPMPLTPGVWTGDDAAWSAMLSGVTITPKSAPATRT